LLKKKPLHSGFFLVDDPSCQRLTTFLDGCVTCAQPKSAQLNLTTQATAIVQNAGSHKAENPSNIAAARVLFGGLGRNRTNDTRIFNAVLQTKDIVFSKFNSGQAKVVCTFCAIVDAEAK
jgi:hypothetical protein